jgi:hypothetical protein
VILRLILVAAALLGLWWGMRWFSKADPAKARKILIAGGLGLLVAIGVLLLLSGKLAGLFAVAAGLAPWISRAMRLHGAWQFVRRFTGQGPAQPDAEQQATPNSQSAMTRQQALEILGLAPGASPEQIKDAHRRLMQVNHPDAGGSTWIAARLNQARDVLLG